ncbi:CHAD domain-containing protein [Roseateles sp.]|uniref:CHAD domain-containing protein n=1 Tax=Roseateles sp. TaxID=1971397 RepID=UPI003BA472FE
MQAAASTRAVKAAALKLRVDISIEQGFEQILRNCLQQIRANEDGLREGFDPEFVHQVRVGIRRLRSALLLFQDWIECPPSLTQEIVWIAQALAAARDAEVLASSTLPALMQACPQEHRLLALQQAASAHAQQLRVEAAATLASERYTALMQALEQWLDQQAWRSGQDGRLQQALVPAAARLLEKRRRQVRKRGQQAQQQQQLLPADASETATFEALHRLRIAIKKLRYAKEFFLSLKTRRQAKAQALSRLIQAQDLLGQLNDGHMAEQQLHNLAQDSHKLRRAADFARGYLRAQSLQLQAQIQALEQTRKN